MLLVLKGFPKSPLVPAGLKSQCSCSFTAKQSWFFELIREKGGKHFPPCKLRVTASEIYIYKQSFVNTRAVASESCSVCIFGSLPSLPSTQKSVDS